MKRKYVMAVLLLLALGIVSTLAFSLTTTDTTNPDAMLIESGTNNIEKLVIIPSDGPDGGSARDADAMAIRLDMDATMDAYDTIAFELVFFDSAKLDEISLPSLTVTYNIKDGTGYDGWGSTGVGAVTVSGGKATFTITLPDTVTTGSDVMWIEIEGTAASGIYTSTGLLLISATHTVL